MQSMITKIATDLYEIVSLKCFCIVIERYKHLTLNIFHRLAFHQNEKNDHYSEFS